MIFNSTGAILYSYDFEKKESLPSQSLQGFSHGIRFFSHSDKL